MAEAYEIIEAKEKYRQHYLSELRSLLKENGIKFNFDDEFLVKFLRSRLYKTDETCSLISNYFANFKKHPQFFENISFAKKAIEAGFFEILPQRNVTGEVIAIMRIGRWEPSQTSFSSLIAATVYAFEMALKSEEAQKFGAIEIIDFTNVRLRQFLKCSVSEIRIMSDMTESSLPIRWRKIFVVNQNYFADMIYAIAKPFLSEQFKELISFLGSDMTQLLQTIPSDILPSSYGGTAEIAGGTEYYKSLEKFEPQLLKLWQPMKTFANISV